MPIHDPAIKVEFNQHHHQKLPDEVSAWVSQCFQSKNWTYECMQEHADTRKYYRIKAQQGQNTILCCAAKPKQAVEQFIHLTQTQKLYGLPVAGVKHAWVQSDISYLMLEDLGPKSLLDCHQAGKLSCKNRYEAALNDVQKIIYAYQRSRLEDTLTLSYYTESKARQQIVSGLSDFAHSMGLTVDWLPLEKSLDQWMKLWQALPMVCTHVDFHSANIISNHSDLQHSQHAWGVVDHQDLCLGPVVYDWVSFIDDHYLRHSPEAYIYWTRQWYETIIEEHRLSYDHFKEAMRVVSIQRHLKNLGVFTKLIQRDKPIYAQPIPGMLDLLTSRVGIEPQDKHWHQILVMLSECYQNYLIGVDF